MMSMAQLQHRQQLQPQLPQEVLLFSRRHPPFPHDLRAGALLSPHLHQSLAVPNTPQQNMKKLGKDKDVCKLGRRRGGGVRRTVSIMFQTLMPMNPRVVWPGHMTHRLLRRIPLMRYVITAVSTLLTLCSFSLSDILLLPIVLDFFLFFCSVFPFFSMLIYQSFSLGYFLERAQALLEWATIFSSVDVPQFLQGHAHHFVSLSQRFKDSHSDNFSHPSSPSSSSSLSLSQLSSFSVSLSSSAFATSDPFRDCAFCCSFCSLALVCQSFASASEDAQHSEAFRASFIAHVRQEVEHLFHLTSAAPPLVTAATTPFKGRTGVPAGFASPPRLMPLPAADSLRSSTCSSLDSHDRSGCLCSCHASSSSPSPSSSSASAPSHSCCCRDTALDGSNPFSLLFSEFLRLFVFPLATSPSLVLLRSCSVPFVFSASLLSTFVPTLFLSVSVDGFSGTLSFFLFYTFSSSAFSRSQSAQRLSCLPFHLLSSSSSAWT